MLHIRRICPRRCRTSCGCCGDRWLRRLHQRTEQQTIGLVLVFAHKLPLAWAS
jgi:hypothetical protein